MTALSLVGVWLAVQPVGLGSYSIAGETVRAELPTWEVPPSGEPTVQVGDMTLRRTTDGILVPVLGNQWRDLPVRLAAAKSEPELWPIRVMIIETAAQVLRYPGFGSMVVRAEIEDRAYQDCLKEMALFAEMAKAYSGGRYEIQFQAEYQRETRYLEDDLHGTNVDLGQLRTRLGITADPKSLWIIHPARTMRLEPFEQFGIPGTRLPFFAIYDPARPGAAARWMFNAWVQQVRRAKHRAQSVVDAGGVIEARFGPTDAVPNLDSSIEALANLEVPVATPALRSALVGFKGRPFSRSQTDSEGRTWVDARLAPWVRQVAPSATLIGGAPDGPKWFLAYRGLSAELPLVNDESVRPAAWSPQNPFNAGQAEDLASSGFFRMATVADEKRGAVGRFSDGPMLSKGWVRILGDGQTAAESRWKGLEFWIRVSGEPWPLDLVVQGDSTQRYRLFGRTPIPVGASYSDVPIRLEVDARQKWARVSVDLTATNLGPIRGVYLAAPPEAYTFDPIGLRVNVDVDDVKLLEVASEVTPLAASESARVSPRDPDPLVRLAWLNQKTSNAAAVEDADRTEIRAMLSDPDFRVVQNAARFFAISADSASLSELLKASRSFDPAIAEPAVQALVQLKDERGWQALETMITAGPFDHNRRAAVRAWRERSGEPRLMAKVSPLLVSRSWQSQREAVQALQAIPGDVAQRVALTFLGVPEPLVRLAVIEGANLTVGPVRTQLAEVAKVDESPLVRAAAAAALAEVGDTLTLDVVSKDSSWMARAELALRVPLGSLVGRNAWRNLASDPRVEVREAAAERIADLVELTEADWASFGNENDRRVLRKLRESAERKNRSLPSALEQRLQEMGG